MNLLAIALAPVLIIIFYMYFRDKYEKEPVGLLLIALTTGALIVIPIIFVEMFLIELVGTVDGLTKAAYHAFIVAATTEEIFKFVALFILIWWNANFNENFDGIVYAVFVSLGFAAVENVLYVLENGIGVGLLRAFTAVPAHALFGIAMGYYFGLAKFTPKTGKYLTLALLFPIFLHGVYDFILMSENDYLLLLFIPFIIYLWIIGFSKMNRHSDTSVFKQQGETM